jgi:hypothetical protein
MVGIEDTAFRAGKISQTDVGRDHRRWWVALHHQLLLETSFQSLGGDLGRLQDDRVSLNALSPVCNSGGCHRGRNPPRGLLQIGLFPVRNICPLALLSQDPVSRIYGRDDCKDPGCLSLWPVQAKETGPFFGTSIGEPGSAIGVTEK